MAELRNPFAVRDEAIILIEDITEEYRGLRCNCRCPSCKDAFIARMGDVKIHHFAHSTEGCDEVQAYMAGLYRLIKEVIDKGAPIYLPPGIVEFSLDEYYAITKETIENEIKLVPKYDKSNCQIPVSDGKKYTFENTGYILNSKGQIQAIILGLQGKVMAIRVTPPNSVCKITDVSKYKDFATLEIDFRNDEEKIRKSSRAELEEYISSSELRSKWIYNPKIYKFYPEIIRRSEDYFCQAEKKRNEIRGKIKKQQEESQKTDLAMNIFEHNKQNQKSVLHLQKITNRQEQEISDEEGQKSGYEEVKNLFTQQVEIIRDRYRIRWVKCEKCGEIKRVSEFAMYGGLNEVNSGRCSICSRL